MHRGGCKIDTEDSPNGKPAIDNPAGGSEDDKNTPGNGNGDNNETVNGGGNDSNNGGSTSDNSTENKTDGENGDNTGDANGGNAGDATGGSGGSTEDTTGGENGGSGDVTGGGSGDSTGDASGGGNGGNTDETTGGGSSGSEDTAPAYSLEGLILKGGWEGGDEGGTYTLSAEKTQTFPVGGQKTDGTNEFGIYNAARKNVWTGSSIPFGTKTELTYIKDGGAPATMESKWQGGDVGISYAITLELESDDGDNPKLWITVTEISEN